LNIAAVARPKLAYGASPAEFNFIICLYTTSLFPLGNSWKSVAG